MLSPRRMLVLLVTCVVAVVLAACGDNTPGTGTPGALVISTDHLSLAAGETITVKATNFDGTVPSPLTWASSNATVATVAPGSEGEVTIRGVGQGAATITAT